MQDHHFPTCPHAYVEYDDNMLADANFLAQYTHDLSGKTFLNILASYADKNQISLEWTQRLKIAMDAANSMDIL